MRKPDTTAATHVTVVVPTYNRADWLREALSSLVDQELGDGLTYEIVVADNNSDDHTREVVGEFEDAAGVAVRYVCETNRGDAHARNAGVAMASGTWIAFFDDDQFATRRWLVELVRCAEMTDAAVVGGPVLLAIDDEKRESLGRICREQLRELDLADHVIEYRRKQLPGTGNALVRRDVYEQLGGFSLNFPSGGSDSDFFLRARKAGFKLVYTPFAPIRHRVDESRLSPEYLRWEALSSGATHCARFDLEQGGIPRLLTRCVARVGQAMLINGPLYLAARLTGHHGDALGRQTLLWRCEGYVRKTFAVVLPRVCSQAEFFNWLKLDTGRSLGGSPS